jgi:hypothetical protein
METWSHARKHYVISNKTRCPLKPIHKLSFEGFVNPTPCTRIEFNWFGIMKIATFSRRQCQIKTSKIIESLIAEQTSYKVKC